MTKNPMLLLLACLLLPGCGHIEVHKQEDLKDAQVGIKYYVAKPYILVARTGATAAPVSVEQIYLPDLAHPYYAKTVAGLGSSKLSLAFSNGMLTTVGQESDPGINGLIPALAGVPGALATAAKTRSETLQKQASDEDLAKASTALASASNTIKQQLARGDARQRASDLQMSTLESIRKALDKESADLIRPGAPARLDDIVKGMKETKKQLEATRKSAVLNSDEAKAWWEPIEQAQGELSNAIGLVSPKEVPPMSFTLYEILMDDSGTSLKEVPFPAAPSK